MYFLIFLGGGGVSFSWPIMATHWSRGGACRSPRIPRCCVSRAGQSRWLGVWGNWCFENWKSNIYIYLLINHQSHPDLWTIGDPSWFPRQGTSIHDDPEVLDAIKNVVRLGTTKPVQITWLPNEKLSLCKITDTFHSKPSKRTKT